MNSFVSKPLIGITKEDAPLRQYASKKKSSILIFISTVVLKKETRQKYKMVSNFYVL